MSNTGVVIFDERGTFVHKFSIPTKDNLTHGERLKLIADAILEYKERYPTKEIAIEAGFTRFNKSTQVIYKVHGLINYLFYDCKQTYIPSTKVKACMCGNGGATKEQVGAMARMMLPSEVDFENEDESDAFGVGFTYFTMKAVEEMTNA